MTRSRLIKRSVLAAALLVAAGIAYCAMIPNARFDVPFEAGKKNSIVETQIGVPTTMTYQFELNLYYDSQNRERVRELAGTGESRDGKRINNGLPIPVRLSIGKVAENGHWSIVDKVFAEHEYGGNAFVYFSKRIIRIQLAPDRYRVRIEALEDIRELDGIPVHFSILVPGNA